MSDCITELKRFQKGWDGPEPLTYPFTEIPDGGDHSRLVSPRIGNAHGLKPPPMPEDGAPFDEMLAEAVEVRLQVLRGEWPSDFLAKYHPRDDFDPERIPEPLQMVVGEFADAEECAASVVGDHPLTVPLMAQRWLLAQDDAPALRRIEPTGHNDFLERVPHPTENLGDALKRNMEKVFEAKYNFGLPRVEEMLGVTGALLTASVNGCPCHPSFPAGHAGAAGAINQLNKEYKTNQRHQNVLFDTAYHQSMWRTLGAFHYAIDNLAGLTLAGYNHWDLLL